MKIFVYNTLSKQKEEFIPLKNDFVGIYTCGPTVYNFQHIGNFKTFLFEDFLKRMFLYNGYQVNHIMNITDVGHLNFLDEKDKMEKASLEQNLSVWELSKIYQNHFFNDLKLLNIIPANHYPKATDFIKEQIDMIEILEEKGFAYIINDGVYFNTAKLENYGKLMDFDPKKIRREERTKFNFQKKNENDFALWKLSPEKEKRQMEWDSPWGKGFPGWHIECSAMSKKFLGNTFDIHCGGIDHISIHHTNEIAQSESCNEVPLANYWMHSAFLEDKGKMSKSKGEFITVQNLIEKGFSALDFRYLCLGTHYKKRLLFKYEILQDAKNSLQNLRNKILDLRNEKSNIETNIESIKEYNRKFNYAINNDLNLSEALAVVWILLEDKEINNVEKLNLIFDFDKIFGLDLNQKENNNIPQEIKKMFEERNKEKLNKNFTVSDQIRKKISELGYEIIDTKQDSIIRKKNG